MFKKKAIGEIFTIADTQHILSAMCYFTSHALIVSFNPYK